MDRVDRVNMKDFLCNYQLKRIYFAPGYFQNIHHLVNDVILHYCLPLSLSLYHKGIPKNEVILGKQSALA